MPFFRFDVVGSTRHQAENAEGYGQAISVLLREIAAVTTVFGGVAIDFTGDGAVVGFLGPGFNVANDMVFDAATVLVADVYEVNDVGDWAAAQLSPQE